MKRAGKGVGKPAGKVPLVMGAAQGLGQPAEVARVAVFLACEDSSYITGRAIYPDGGRMALHYTVPVD